MAGRGRATRQQHRIVVLGAGYTGLMGALGVARRTRRLGGKVVLVNPSARFTERLRMHQIATAQRMAEIDIPSLVEPAGIEFVQGWATRIDRAGRVLHVDTAQGPLPVPYDTLVYATGSAADTDPVPGASLHAHTLNSPTEAARLAGRLAQIGTGTVAVGGAGLTGLEAATEIAESYPGIHVILLGRNEPAAMMGPRARAHVQRALDRLGVEVRAGVEITKVLPDGVELGDEIVPADAVLWTTGFRASPLAAEAGLTVDATGRIVVDETLRAVSDPAIYAIGDAAAIHQAWGVIHGTCQSGIPTGAHAAASIARRMRGREARPFRFGYLHQPVSLGRRDAVIQFTHADDTPRRWYLRGRAAVRYKETVTSSPRSTYRLARRVPLPAAAMSSRGGRAARRLPAA
ncbi:FAD-dependent oxidoreductase [Frankia sp. CNm7]|uniref:FAD-dependent oxidoreductase n=1 Tax=Frankia nepalensis TaxID=1836974 RepID=A0A937RGG4_9ACTN|nr:FAD-dependent oxidoreductase [Frankia nepalensis]MBL7498422.1 FAD-dependent oxidoreductase [Frankia nepalensis]MBL7509964.1 FAD-dependent oxidoreductase [Frankia nepalensis]MBL7520182.1 FAD-dependent oxidoreductase [Frankia nepalensis]MBL7629752.1 FAD-dependent oxidoreductase [Frankia nepalensis]